MSSTKTIDKQRSVNHPDGYSKEYHSIRKEAESKWPAWKVLTHNLNFATSAHAKKIVRK